MAETHPRFGRYQVTGVLGRGAMGIVYLADDPLIGRQVAVKVIRSEPGLDPEEAEDRRLRFEREFRAAGTLSHPSIVTVYDVGHDSGASYIAMEATAAIKTAYGVTSNIWGLYNGANERVGFDMTATPRIRIAGTAILGARKTGWTVATGTATRTAFDTSTVTLPQLAERVKAIIDDLHSTAGHGLIGT